MRRALRSCARRIGDRARSTQRITLALILAVLLVFSVTTTLAFTTFDIHGAAGGPDYSGTGPGTLIRVDQQADAGGTRVARIAYRSTDPRSGGTTEVTGTAFLPPGRPPAGGWPVVAVGRDIATTEEACDPPTPGSLEQAPVVIQYLSRGYAVAVTDYRSPGAAGPHSYLDSGVAGRNIIDSVRSLRRAFPGISTRWAAVGILQGGGGAWEADALASTYAPELHLVGAVALSPTADMTGLVSAADRGTLTTDQAAILSWTLPSVATEHPGLDVTAYRADLAEQGAPRSSDCSGPMSPAGGVIAPAAGAVTSGSDTSVAGQTRSLLARSAVTGHVLSAPLSVVYGSDDTIVVPASTTAAIRRTCATDSIVSWQLVHGSGRSDTDRNGQLSWVADRFAGIPAANACHSTTIAARDSGELVNTEPIPGIAALMPEGSHSAAVTYRSTEGDTGRSTLVSGTVFTPAGPAPTGGWPVIAVGHGTIGIENGCGPSSSPTLLGQSEFVSRFLSFGFAVTLADYQGLGTEGVHPYLDARTAGLNIIDSVRALRTALPGVSNRWAAIGSSQGGAAVWAADEQAGTYAPELTMVGAVALAPAASVTDIVDKARRGTLSALQIPAMALIIDSTSRLDPQIDVNDFRRGAAARYWGSTPDCGGPLTSAGNALSDISSRDLAPANPQAAADLTEILSRWALPQRPVTAPLSVAYGSADNLVDARWTTDALRRACSMGDTVMIRLQAGRGHTDVDLSGQLEWLRDRFTGAVAPNDCP